MLLVRGRLPVVRVDGRGLQAALDALEREHEIRAPFLRVVRRTEANDRVTTLLEFDAPLSARGDWARLDGVDVAAVVPVFADGVAQWLGEQLGTPIPEQRARGPDRAGRPRRAAG